MIGRATLTRGEFQLMSAIVGVQALPGLNGLALRREASPKPQDREGLLAKGLLEAGEDGRYQVNQIAGYLFSGMANCTASLRMDMAFSDATQTRKILYLVDDAFVLVDWFGENQISYAYMATIPQAMGTLLSIIRDETGDGVHSEAVLADDPTARMILRASAGNPLEVRAAVHLVTEGTEADFEGVDVSFVVDRNGNLHRALSNEGGTTFKSDSVEDLFGPASEKVLAVHRARIMAKQE